MDATSRFTIGGRHFEGGAGPLIVWNFTNYQRMQRPSSDRSEHQLSSVACT
jgi:hypothetical protein